MSLKKQILDKIMILPELISSTSKTTIRDAVTCERSVLFTNVLKLNEDIVVPDTVDYLNNLVFEDIMVMTDCQVAGSEDILKNGTVARIYRIDETTIGLSLFQIASNTNNYVLFANYHLDYGHQDLHFTLQFGIDTLKEKLANDFVDQHYVLLLGVIYKLQSFERIVKFDPRNSLKLRKLNFQQKATYVEYTIDLSKPTTLMSDSKGGHHASPREHLRRGHFRTSKQGRRYFVKATVVNKGSKTGKIDKAYTLGN